MSASISIGPRTESGRQAARRRRRSNTVVLRLWQLLVLVAIIGIWQLVCSLNLVDPVIAKTPRQVFSFLRGSWDSGQLQRNTAATMEAVLIAFVLAAAVGILVGVSLALMPRVEQVLMPFLDAANAMPRIALAPVFIVWLGIGMAAKIALAFSVVVFVVLSSASAGVRSADPEILRISAVLNISKPQLFWKVLLPVAVPSIFAGLRLGLIYSLLGVVGSEIIASQDGLGQLIAYYSGTYEMQAVYGILVVLALIAAVLNVIMATVERHLLRWQPGSTA